MKYLYRFGYCTPSQWTLNESHGWDDEDSNAFFVIARSPEDALRWGREISEALCSHLFLSWGWEGPIPSWKDSSFAHWIEEDPEAEFSPQQLSNLAVVKDGEMPDVSDWAAAMMEAH